MKKTILFCLLTLMSIASWADDGDSYGEKVDWDLSDDGVLTISGKGAMDDYFLSHPAPWGSTIKTVKIGNGVTSIGDYAFYDCSRLTSVTIPNSVTSIGENAFCYCSGLTSVTIPNSVTKIKFAAFCYCTGLTSVNINDIESWCKISFEGRFSNPLSYSHNLYIGGNKVTDLIIPNSMTSIGDYAFSDCKGLTSIAIPNSVTSIGNYAFSGCKGLTSVTIPNSVTYIGDKAFDIFGLTSATIECLVPPFGMGSLSSCNAIYVPEVSLEKYYTYDGWSEYRSHYKTIESTLTKCATPSITYSDGAISLDCATEGAKFEYTQEVQYFTQSEEKKLLLNPVLNIKIYATAEGHAKSEPYELNIPLESDVELGKITIGDVTKLIDKYLNQ